MTNYVPPIEDIEFLLNEVVNLDEICDLAGYEEISPDLVTSILIEAGRFASVILAPLNRVGDIEGSYLENDIVFTPTGWKEAYQEFIKGGWSGLLLDPEYGGQGLPQLVGVAVQELWDGANMSFALCPMLTQTAAELIAFQGTLKQKKIYLERLVKGEWTGTMNLTEPQAGSDLSSIRTRAVNTGDGHYLITGQKIYITYGDHDLTDNIVHLVLARTPDAPEGVKGISLFIVPKFLPTPEGASEARNDIRTVAIEKKLGIHASPTAVLSYGDAGGAIGYLLGEENRGLEYMFFMMNRARHAVGIEAYAIAEQAYQHALAYAEQRVQGKELDSDHMGRVPIIRHPDVARMVMEMRCRIEAMRALSLYTAAVQDRARRHPDQEKRMYFEQIIQVLTPIVKGWSSEIGSQITSQAIQVFGGMGFIEETGAAQYYRDSRITTIYEGTSGIQAADLVGRKLLSDRGTVIEGLIRTIKEELDILSRQSPGCAELDEINTGVHSALVQLESATEWILEVSRRDPRLPLAASFYYLMLWGSVAGGWQMARSARVATRKLSEDAKRCFYREKLFTARCYTRYVLPICTSYSVAIERGSELMIEENKF